MGYRPRITTSVQQWTDNSRGPPAKVEGGGETGVAEQGGVEQSC